MTEAGGMKDEPMSDLDRLVERLKGWVAKDCGCPTCVIATDAAATITRLREALEPFAKTPDVGEYGGPMVSVRVLYEDMLSTDVHIGTKFLTPADFRRARQALGGEHG